MRILKFFMFNRFVRAYLHSDFWFLRWNKRVKSVVLELWYTLSVFFPYLVILALPAIIVHPNAMDFKPIDLLTLVPFSLMMIALVNKDFFGGQSVVHRLLGYQVFDIKTNNPASRIKCLLRNVIGLLWPIEVIFILTYPQRRLGDFIAGTILIDVPISDPELILNEMKKTTFDNQARLTLLLSVVWVLAMIVLSDSRINLW